MIQTEYLNLPSMSNDIDGMEKSSPSRQFVVVEYIADWFERVRLNSSSIRSRHSGVNNDTHTEQPPISRMFDSATALSAL